MARDDDTRDERRPRSAGLLALAMPLGVAVEADPILARADNPRACSTTTAAQFEACRHEAGSDFFGSKALCINVSDRDERTSAWSPRGRSARRRTNSAAPSTRSGWRYAKNSARLATTRTSTLPISTATTATSPSPNPYFPLTIGYRWDYGGSLETNTIVVLDETKLIEGVTCIVLNDKRYEDGLLAEDTDDWYGQRKDGTVDFCGEAVSNFETFPGDNPVRPERVSTDGQWKTGRDGVPSGAYILDSRLTEGRRCSPFGVRARSRGRYGPIPLHELRIRYRPGARPERPPSPDRLVLWQPRLLGDARIHGDRAWRLHPQVLRARGGVHSRSGPEHRRDRAARGLQLRSAMCELADPWRRKGRRRLHEAVQRLNRVGEVAPGVSTSPEEPRRAVTAGAENPEASHEDAEDGRHWDRTSGPRLVRPPERDSDS
jgi:hypothetical protein